MSMTEAQGDLFNAHAAGDDGAAAALDHADKAWAREAEYRIRLLPPGTEFLAEDIVERLAGLGYETHDKRAMGGMIRAMAKAKVIKSTGRTAPAKTSHGAHKMIWQRVSW